MADGGGGLAEPESLRLDRFLWFARLTRTRSAAQALAASGAIRLDGRRILRAHSPVRVGSTVAFVDLKVERGAVRILRVVQLPARRGPAAEAEALYVDLASEPGRRGSPAEAPSLRRSGERD